MNLLRVMKRIVEEKKGSTTSRRSGGIENVDRFRHGKRIVQESRLRGKKQISRSARDKRNKKKEICLKSLSSLKEVHPRRPVLLTKTQACHLVHGAVPYPGSSRLFQLELWKRRHRSQVGRV